MGIPRGDTLSILFFPGGWTAGALGKKQQGLCHVPPLEFLAERLGRGRHLPGIWAVPPFAAAIRDH